ncbi:MAG: aminoacyl-tRNA hydrolase [Chloroflexi bacterium]|nr:aminoacyl-tRNA hydrolase [Chloroflexota bacterium]
MRVIVGLGNPGRQYDATRHNVGFWCMDELARRHGMQFERRHRLALIAQGQIAGGPVVLAKPRTFMNRSGEAVRYLLDRFHSVPGELLVINDDMDLPAGKLRLRPRGSSGGHHGLDSIIAQVGTQEFPRVRIGVGRPPSTAEGVEHVLGGFSRTERALVDDAIRRAADAVEAVLSQGIDVAMNLFN